MSKSDKHKDWKHTVIVQPLGWGIMVVTPSSLADYLKHMKYHKCGKDFRDEVARRTARSENGSDATFYHDDRGNYIMMLPDKYMACSTYHEALHAAIDMWEQAGAQLKLFRNQEVLTYTQGHIVDMIRKTIYELDEE